MTQQSVLQFQKTNQQGSGLYAPRNCMDFSCNSSGRWQVWIMGRNVGCVCNAHRVKWIAAWEGALDRGES